MFTVNRSARVMYSAGQMFSLIDDIESYPEFIRGCIGAEILSRTSREVRARIILGHKGIKYKFSTRNELQAPGAMTMHLLEGPFKEFEGRWRFDELNDGGCDVSLNLRFDFRSALMNLTAGCFIESVANRLVDELHQRADRVYG